MMSSDGSPPGNRRQPGAPPDRYTVWIGAAEKIASFHPVADYEGRTFLCHEHFLHFLCSLQDQGYRFQ